MHHTNILEDISREYTCLLMIEVYNLNYPQLSQPSWRKFLKAMLCEIARKYTKEDSIVFIEAYLLMEM